MRKEKDGIAYEGDWIVFRYKGKQWSLYRENEKKPDGDEYFTYDEAIEYCKELKDRHLPSIEEQQELLKAWCEWKGYKMDGNAVYSDDNTADNIGKEFATEFKLPLAGRCDYSSDSLLNQGSCGYYWSSSPYGSDYPNRARYLYLISSYVSASNYNRRAYGLSVRCFRYSTSEEKVRFLEECLDRKELLNIGYRKEIKNLTKCNLNLQEHIDKVEEENRKLKEEIERLKKQCDARYERAYRFRNRKYTVEEKIKTGNVEGLGRFIGKSRNSENTIIQIYLLN